MFILFIGRYVGMDEGVDGTIKGCNKRVNC